jgi:hypothetical protein
MSDMKSAEIVGILPKRIVDPLTGKPVEKLSETNAPIFDKVEEVPEDFPGETWTFAQNGKNIHVSKEGTRIRPQITNRPDMFDADKEPIDVRLGMAVTMTDEVKASIRSKLSDK